MTDDPLALYKRLCQIPSVISGRIAFSADGDLATVNTTWDQRDLLRNEIVKLVRKYIIELSPKDKSPKKVSFAFPPDEINEMHRSFSCCGSKMAVFRTAVPTKRSGAHKCADSCEFLDIYDCLSGYKISSHNLSSMEKHGKLNFTMSKCQWSPDSRKLLYIAEKFTKAVGYSDPKYSGPASATEENDEFCQRENWGDGMSTISEPVIVIFDTHDGSVNVFENLLDGYCPSEPIWLPDGEHIMFVAIKCKPVKLGLAFCQNRECQLAVCSVENGKCDVIKGGCSFSSPRLIAQSKKLVFFQREICGTHGKSARLIVRDWCSKQGQMIIEEIVKTEIYEDMPGLYPVNIPERCWSNDGNTIYLTAIMGSQMVIVAVDTKTLDFSVVVNPDKTRAEHSLQILDVHNNYLLYVGSCPNRPPYLALAKIENGQRNQIVQLLLPESSQCDDLLKSINWQVLNFRRSVLPDEPAELENMIYEAIYITPAIKKSYPLILWPHGGPHSVYLTSYALLPAFLALMGFAVLRVNYRGSIGFGDDFLNSLPGRIGSLEVLDCRHACSAACELDSRVDANRLAVLGASHGGFVALHLIGQFASEFAACVAVNPVVDISAMYNCTDIPDWCTVEALSENYKPDQVVSPQSQIEMWQMSPISHAEKVKTPTLFLFGTDDLRVPSSQARQLVNVLRSRGIATRVLCYPNNGHQLSKVDVECDVALNSVAWLLKHMKMNVE